jgi:hypothetical protein
LDRVRDGAFDDLGVEHVVRQLGMVIAQSSSYSPKSADALLPVLAEYVHPEMD